MTVISMQRGRLSLLLAALWAAGCGGSGGTDTVADDAGQGDCPTCESACGEAGCAEGVACSGAGADVSCDVGTCWPGYTADGDTCTLTAGGTCDDALEAECAAVGRDCNEVSGGATCGTCLPGYEEANLNCAASTACEAAGCPGQNRTCAAAGCGECLSGFADVDGTCTAADCSACSAQNRECSQTGNTVSCGACLNDFFEQDDECVAFVSCEDLDCAGQNRTCVDAAQSFCDDDCIGNLVWDADTESCRAPTTCETVAATCDEGATCIEGGEGEDASCVADCAVGTAFATAAAGGPGCFSCSDSSASSARCAGLEGATGRLVNVSGGANGRCVCETQEGYFPQGANGTPQSCDSDGDGWVVVDAVEFTESSDPGFTEQARCDVRRVQFIRLESDDPYATAASTTLDLLAEPVGAGRGAALPLYERAANDRAGETAPSQDGYPVLGSSTPATLAEAELNSFTKACVIADNDFNLNGLEDYTESQLDRPAGGAGEPLGDLPAVAVDFFGQYTRFSYFVEINEGWFEAPNTYVIAERPRDPQHSPDRERIALLRQGEVLEASSSAPAPMGGTYWRACGRRDDVRGGDFSAAHLEAQAGVSSTLSMGHHSQFRCVLPATGPAQYSVASNAEIEPYRAFWTDGTDAESRLSWRETDGDPTAPFAVGNVCYPEGGAYQRTAAASGPNPDSRSFRCNVSDRAAAPLATNQLVWAVADYHVDPALQTDATDESNSQDPTSYEYLRGCINECADFGVDHCPTWDPENPSAGFRCDLDNPGDQGQILCGCGDDFSGPANGCQMACGGDSTFRSPGFDIFRRGLPEQWSEADPGYWACVDRSLTSTQAGSGTAAVLLGGDYLLRGGIPATATVTNNAPLVGSDPGTGRGYRLSNRVRAEISAFGG